MENIIKDSLQAASAVLSVCQSLEPEIRAVAEKTVQTLQSGGTLFLIGNGGSATQCQHIAAEFVNRFKRERRPLSASALTADIATLTSISNDYGFDFVFQKQLQALAKPNDLVFVLTTSDVSSNPGGHSKNIELALLECQKKGIFSVGFFSEKTVKAKALANLSICVPSKETQHIQESHLAILHIICDWVEHELQNKAQSGFPGP